ncbi:MAG: fused MFS/spermidine synthase, partial [Candidatus Tectomicrobia bacterium]|nr:fused MFS/spermidine synthase [Candidatus Tectomicrobia bacterium]
LILLCFLLSGFSGLIYEVIWVRMLILIFGSTTFAMSTVLAAFMGGLALGSFLGGRMIDHLRAPLLIYGLLEVGIGCFALVVPSLISALTPFYQFLWEQFHLAFYTFSLIRFLLIFTLLMIPTTLMGATLPTLSRYCTRHEARIGFSIGLLYSVNTFGAVLGTALAGFILLPTVGMRHTISIAAAMNIVVGLLAVTLSCLADQRRFIVKEEAGPSFSHPPTSSPKSTQIVLLAFALSGFAAMVYEVAWSRGLSLILGSSVYAFTIMLTTFLAGLALGSSFSSIMIDRVKKKIALFGSLELLIGLLAFSVLFLFAELPYLFLLLYRRLAHSYTLLLSMKFLLAFLVMLAPTLLLGAIFPVVTTIVVSDLRRIGKFVGDVYSINTLGAILGSFSTGFLLIPIFGIQKSLLLAITLNLTLGILLILFSELSTKTRFIFASFALLVALIIPLQAPSWDPLVMSSGVFETAPRILTLTRKEFYDRLKTPELLFYKEGIMTTVTVARGPDQNVYLQVNGKVDASSKYDMPTQVLSAHFPLLLADRLDEVLVIGFASGVTVGSVEQYPVKQIVAVELEPAVIEASKFFEVNNKPLEDPRLEVIVNDGRNYLLTSSQRFDLIISEPSNPWMTGASNLFTKEFFLLVAERLKEGGIFCQWLQLYGISPENLRTLVKTFHTVFPEIFLFSIEGYDLILIGSRAPVKIDIEKLKQRLSHERIRNDLRRVGVEGLYTLLAHFRLGSQEIPSYVGDAPLNTDDNALIEFSAPKDLYLNTRISNGEAISKASRGILPYLKNVGTTSHEAANTYLLLAEAFLERGRRKEAWGLVEASLSFHETAQGHRRLGDLYWIERDERQALREWERALELEPAHLDTLLSLGSYYIDKGEYEKAREFLTQVVEQHEESWMAHYLLGVSLHHLNEHQHSFFEYERAFDYFRASQPIANRQDLTLMDMMLSIYRKKMNERKGKTVR